ncbi:hypothetical protein [Halalkalicoccus tibetensis]|uniref:DUF2283 domain-containing protein n=1 Tax=Halalkalicoccus tibetensis TaxID=175632 RepID=A0ABD5V546_9EURY
MVEVTYENADDEVATIRAEEARVSPQERYLQVVVTEGERQLDIPTRRVIAVERDPTEEDDDSWTASAQYL